jgi:hypothetical protein
MTFQDAPRGDPEPSFFTMTLPQIRCTTCGRAIARRKHRIQIKASWRVQTETLCPECWHTVCEWASRFALAQLPLPI